MGIYRYKSGNLEPLTNEGGTSGLPVGSIVAFAGGSPNTNWLLCDGSEFDTEAYPALWTYLGSNILPDLRECVLVGAGENSTHTIASHDVYEVGEFKDDQLQSHTHSISYSYGSPAGSGVGLIGQTSGGTTSTGAIRTGRSGDTTHGKQIGVNYFIKATSAGIDVDSNLYAYKQYVRDQNELSDYETFSITTTNSSPFEYDGVLVVSSYNNTSKLYINNVDIGYSGSSNTTAACSVTALVRKGDVARVGSTVLLYAKVAFYKKRDYTGR